MHLLGQMLQVPGGEDRILWGTDSIWGGSPQSQIVRLRRFKIADDLLEKFKYPQVTDAVKAKIFGLNAAKLFGVDPAESRKAIHKDKLTGMRLDYDGSPQPSNTQYGWVWSGGRKTPPALPFRA
jgi:hypothetical protein